MRPTTMPSASTSKSSSFHWPDGREAARHDDRHGRWPDQRLGPTRRSGYCSASSLWELASSYPDSRSDAFRRESTPSVPCAGAVLPKDDVIGCCSPADHDGEAHPARLRALEGVLSPWVADTDS